MAEVLISSSILSDTPMHFELGGVLL